MRLTTYNVIWCVLIVPSEKVSWSMRKTHGVRFSQRMRKVSSGHLLSIDTFYTVQWFCKRTAKALITARMRRLMWAFAVRICPKWHFPMARPTFRYRVNIPYSYSKVNICTSKRYNIVEMNLAPFWKVVYSKRKEFALHRSRLSLWNRPLSEVGWYTGKQTGGHKYCS